MDNIEEKSEQGLLTGSFVYDLLEASVTAESANFSPQPAVKRPPLKSLTGMLKLRRTLMQKMKLEENITKADVLAFLCGKAATTQIGIQQVNPKERLFALLLEDKAYNLLTETFPVEELDTLYGQLHISSKKGRDLTRFELVDDNRQALLTDVQRENPAVSELESVLWLSYVRLAWLLEQQQGYANTTDQRAKDIAQSKVDILQALVEDVRTLVIQNPENLFVEERLIQLQKCVSRCLQGDNHRILNRQRGKISSFFSSILPQTTNTVAGLEAIVQQLPKKTTSPSSQELQPLSQVCQ